MRSFRVYFLFPKKFLPSILQMNSNPAFISSAACEKKGVCAGEIATCEKITSSSTTMSRQSMISAFPRVPLFALPQGFNSVMTRTTILQDHYARENCENNSGRNRLFRDKTAALFWKTSATHHHMQRVFKTTRMLAEIQHA